MLQLILMVTDNAEYHEGLLCLLRLKQSLGREIHFIQNLTSKPLKYKIWSAVAQW